MFRTPEIMATLGPTLETPDDLCRAIEAGARWFRLPCGYRQRPHVDNARAVRSAAAACGRRVQLLLDLPSSRPRTGKMEELRPEPGLKVRFREAPAETASPDGSGRRTLPLPGLSGLLGKIRRGHRLWFCDGRLEFRVDEVDGDCLLAHLERGAVPLKSSNSICLPDSSNAFAMATPADRELLDSFAQQQLTPDWVAFSFTSNAQDVRAGREELRRVFADKVRLMAKIETAAGVERVEEILEVADGIMVARGDLGPAVEFVRLPEVQEELVAAARRAGKPVVVATHVLEYFAEVGQPLRAELSGLSLLAMQGPDAVMLGKETVYSPRPIECIELANEVLTYESRRFAERAASERRLPARAVPAASDSGILRQGALQS
jgi:pyruvate kinase